MAALSRVHELYFRDVDRSSLIASMLDSLLALTGSEYCYIGEVLIDDHGAPYQVTWAITDISWNAESRRLFEANVAADGGLVVTRLDSLFGRVLLDRAPVVANDPMNDPRRGGLPRGHPPLCSFIGIPLIRDGSLVGAIGLANRPGGYTADDADELDPLTSLCALLIDVIRTDRERAAAQEAERRVVDEMRREHHLALLGRLAGGVAHDMKNIVSSISLNCDLLAATDPDRTSVDRSVGRIREACESMSAMTTRLNEVWSGGTGTPTCDPVATVVGFHTVMRSLVAPGLRFEVDLPVDDVPAVGFAASDLFQVISNLVVNASEALIEDGRSSGSIVLTVRAGADGASVTVSVGDDGPGIDPVVGDDAFVASVSTKGAGRGVGLATVVTLAEAAGGTVRARTRGVGRGDAGTIVEVTLPAVVG
jgi:signal transduction histidine kinase